MDVRVFLKSKTDFIRFFYDEAVKPFDLIKEQIEDSEPPFDNPPYSEDGEPAFLEEWMNSGTAKNIVGITSISMLSDTLKGYLESLRTRVIGFSIPNEQKKKLFSDGFVPAYRTVLGEILDTDWSDCGINFDTIEQVVLARNSGQHVMDITGFQAEHDSKAVIKFTDLLFVSEERLKGEAGSLASLVRPDVVVTRETLFLAILEVEKLAEWIDNRMDKIHEWRHAVR